ncbi:MAG: lysoplasmalogenase [Bacteroidetes bacterium]|nr:lysoplasmalogenase [Bacteroidota bacterium]
MWKFVIYAIIGILNIISIATGYSALNYVTKVLLMPCLMWIVPTKNKADIVIYFALFFSWLGDIFLMFPRVHYSETMRLILFLSGLISFLITHILYIFYFINEHKPALKAGIMVQKPYLFVPFVLYLLAFISYLFPHLGALKIPIVIYGLCIVAMSVAALNRKGFIPNKSFYFVFCGSLLFIASDTILASEIFIQKMEWQRIAIMATYILAQALIVKGITAKYITLGKN